MSHALLSYHYWDDPELYEELASLGYGVLADSGAYSAYESGAEIDLDEYIRFCKQVEVYVDGYFALDAIGDPAESRRNVARMEAAGLDPIPVWQGHDPTFDGLQEWADGHSWVALGSIVSAEGWECPPNYKTKRIVSFVRRIRSYKAETKIHLLGYTNTEWLRKVRPYSVDAATGIGHAFASDVTFWDPATASWYDWPGSSDEKPSWAVYEAAKRLVGAPDSVTRERLNARTVDANDFGAFQWPRCVFLGATLQRFQRIERETDCRIYLATPIRGELNCLRWLARHGVVSTYFEG